MRGHIMSRVWGLALGAVFMMGLLGVLGGIVGCGEGVPGSTSDTPSSVTSVSASGQDAAPVTTSEDASPDDSAEVVEVFAVLAQTVAPMPIYGLAELPAGVTVPAEWWPVVDLEIPSDYEGPVVTNPRVSGGPEADLEVQLVLAHGEGWIIILENLRGDLGDVTGEQVGTIAGHTATLYEVNGGTLVQWSDGGRWYGVFGRGVPVDEVVQLSLKMQLVSGAETE